MLKKELEERGHAVKLIFASTRETTMAVCKYEVEDNNRCLKSEKNTSNWSRMYQLPGRVVEREQACDGFADGC